MQDWVRHLARMLSAVVMALFATQAGAVSLQWSKVTEASAANYVGSFSASLGEFAGTAQLLLANASHGAARITRVFIQDLDQALVPGVAGTAPPITLAGAFVQPTAFDVRLNDGGASKLSVVKIVKDFTGLGLKESKDLVDAAPSIVGHNLSPEDAAAFRQALIEAGASAVSLPLNGGGVGFQVNLPQQQVISAYDVVLTDGGANKLSVVKIVKDFTGLGLKESKDLVDAAPAVVLRGTDAATAHQLAQLLAEAGAAANLKAISHTISMPIVLPGGGQQLDASIELLLDYEGLAENPDLLFGLPLQKSFEELLGTPGSNRFRLGVEVTDAAGADLYLLAAVPEPQTWMLLLGGILVLGRVRSISAGRLVAPARS